MGKNYHSCFHILEISLEAAKGFANPFPLFSAVQAAHCSLHYKAFDDLSARWSGIWTPQE